MEKSNKVIMALEIIFLIFSVIAFFSAHIVQIMLAFGAIIINAITITYYVWNQKEENAKNNKKFVSASFFVFLIPFGEILMAV